MSAEFIEKSVWRKLTKAAKSCRGPANVAVAYFSKGASKILPLPANSQLVVDASERAVRSGLTCPNDLLLLLKRGCRIYSLSNLHSKVYVFGTRAYIGSANASQSSATRLVEAMVATTDRQAVASAKEFVRSLCKDPLSPEILSRLQKLYRPPKLPAGANNSKAQRNGEATARFKPLRIVKLKIVNWSESDDEASDRGWETAKKRRRHSRSWTTDKFRWDGKCAIQRNERVLQVLDEGDGRVMVSPLATVLHIRRYKVRGLDRAIVYVELPEGRRRAFDSLSKKLGNGAARKLNRGGLVRDSTFANAVRTAWPQ